MTSLIIPAVHAQETSDRVRKDIILPLKPLFEEIIKEMHKGFKSVLVENYRTKEKHFAIDDKQRKFLETLGYSFERGEALDNPEINHSDFDDVFICWP